MHASTVCVCAHFKCMWFDMRTRWDACAAAGVYSFYAHTFVTCVYLCVCMVCVYMAMMCAYVCVGGYLQAYITFLKRVCARAFTRARVPLFDCLYA